MTVTPDNIKPTNRERLQKATRSNSVRGRSHSECVDLLRRLYEESHEGANGKLENLFRWSMQTNALKRQVDATFMYKDYISEDARVLDWGCKHAKDSCLLRFLLGDQLQLLGYDFGRGDVFEPFYAYSQLQFTEADHTYKLPYEDDSLDVVISSGVLEHVAQSSESLKELYRVLKPGGIFVVTFLPNRYSWVEWTSRKLGLTWHRRLYTKHSASDLLLHHGFEPHVCRYHQFVPAQKFQAMLKYFWWMNPVLQSCPPFKYFCSNLVIIAEKRTII